MAKVMIFVLLFWVVCPAIFLRGETGGSCSDPGSRSLCSGVGDHWVKVQYSTTPYAVLVAVIAAATATANSAGITDKHCSYVRVGRYAEGGDVSRKAEGKSPWSKLRRSRHCDIGQVLGQPPIQPIQHVQPIQPIPCTDKIHPFHVSLQRTTVRSCTE